MKQEFFEIIENRPLAESVYELTLSGDTGEVTAPGQFVNILIGGHFLRRPISVCDWEAGKLTLIYKVVGEGTKELSEMQSGTLDILTGLGNGYDIGACGETPLLVGGGAGVPPMYGLCKTLIKAGAKPTVILGFNRASEVFYENEFKALGAETLVSTADGSAGIKGFVTDAVKTLDKKFSSYCACGPEPMLKALSGAMEIRGQLSFEERMACGFGACMGCSCKTKYGTKRICKDGPVLRSDEVIW